MSIGKPEQRRFNRMRCEGNAVLSCRAGQFRVRVRDLSLRGVLVERPSGASIPPGEAVKLQIELPDMPDPIVVTGSVAHADDLRLGIHCEQIDIDSATLLRRFVELHLGDSALLVRELRALMQ